MRTVFLLFDSLNLRALSCHGGALPTPNFDRLAARSAVFDRHFVGSLPCMPARRDLHTGRLGFLHRSWGPLEPYDDSFPQLLKQSGTYSHLVSDHYHYFEDGGATYHTRYTTWDFIRGQESDPWIAMVKPPLERFREQYHPLQIEEDRNGHRLQGAINRTVVKQEADFPAVKCFDAALAFLDANAAHDDWLLHVETFDPHEPFHAPDGYNEGLETTYDGPVLDWPRYKNVDESPEEIAELKANYTALVRLCDAQLGRILDFFDAHDLWKNTALILTTDHGFLLGEHDWWAKNRMPFYNEIAHIPLFIHHPNVPEADGERIGALTQTMDLMPTMLELHELAPGAEVQGRTLLPLLSDPTASIREIALYGIFGGAINATDGRYTYFRYPERMESTGLNEYTLMPMHNRSFFEIRELEQAALTRAFNFTKGAPVLRVPALPDAKRSPRQGGFADAETVLYDLTTDPAQESAIEAPEVVERIESLLIAEMVAHEAPAELYERFSLPRS